MTLHQLPRAFALSSCGFSQDSNLKTCFQFYRFLTSQEFCLAFQTRSLVVQGLCLLQDHCSIRPLPTASLTFAKAQILQFKAFAYYNICNDLCNPVYLQDCYSSRPLPAAPWPLPKEKSLISCSSRFFTCYKSNTVQGSLPTALMASAICYSEHNSQASLLCVWRLPFIE